MIYHSLILNVSLSSTILEDIRGGKPLLLPRLSLLCIYYAFI